MSRSSWIKVMALAFARRRVRGGRVGQGSGLERLLPLALLPPQVPGNGFEYNGLYDGWYRYPREQRIVPQIQGPYYRNEYGGHRIFGMFSHPNGWHGWQKKKFYQGMHFTMDVF